MKRSVKVFCGQQALLFGFQPEAHQLSFSNVDQKTRTWCRNCWKEKKGESIFPLNIYQFYQSLWKPCEILAKSFLNIYQFPESSWKFISFLNPREILVKSCLNIYQFPKSLWKFTTFLNPCEILPQYLPVSRILVKICSILVKTYFSYQMLLFTLFHHSSLINHLPQTLLQPTNPSNDHTCNRPAVSRKLEN